MVDRFDVRTLPPSIRDTRTAALAEVTRQALVEPDFRRLVFEAVADAPAEALPALIREWSIEEFVEPGMSEPVIRRLLAAAFELHADKGYLVGIRRGLDLLGMRVHWLQWFEASPPAAPGTHRAVIRSEEFIFDDAGAAPLLDARVQRAAVRMIDGMKRWSQDVDIAFVTGTDAPLALAGAVSIAAVVRLIGYEPGVALVVGAAVSIAGVVRLAGEEIH